MSKITFRADDDLVEELESLEASKSEAMREALRAYLGASDERSVSDTDSDANSESEREHSGEPAIDDIVRKHVDDLLTERLAEFERERERGRGHPDNPRHPRARTGETQDVNVTIALEGAEAHRVDDSARGTPTHEQDPDHDHSQPQGRGRDQERDRGTTCGQCGEDVDGDHVYCPNCGEKASRRLFCECGDELRSDWAFCPSCGRRTASADVLESNSRRT